MLILSQFVLRLSFGLAFAMAITSPKKVTSGFFRNHAYVLLGLNVLALLAAFAYQRHLNPKFGPWWLLPGAVASYAAGAVWLYEKKLIGQILLWIVAACALFGMWFTQATPMLTEWPTPWRNVVMYDLNYQPFIPAVIFWRLDAVSSGLLLGSTIAAMFLGHWYLNTPTMELAPLRRLLLLMAVAIVIRAIASGTGLVLDLQTVFFTETPQYPLVALRWLSGIFGAAALTWMAWQTIKIPNTQSATGILFVAVIATFLGELTSLLLCSNNSYPL